MLPNEQVFTSTLELASYCAIFVSVCLSACTCLSQPTVHAQLRLHHGYHDLSEDLPLFCPREIGKYPTWHHMKIYVYWCLAGLTGLCSFLGPTPASIGSTSLRTPPLRSSTRSCGLRWKRGRRLGSSEHLLSLCTHGLIYDPCPFCLWSLYKFCCN